MHCLELFIAYVLSPLAGLWLYNVSCVPRLQLGALNVVLWINRQEACHPSGENPAGFSWRSTLGHMGRVLKTQAAQNADGHCRTERHAEVWCALPLGQLCSSAQLMAAKGDRGEITGPSWLLLP